MGRRRASPARRRALGTPDALRSAGRPARVRGSLECQWWSLAWDQTPGRGEAHGCLRVQASAAAAAASARRTGGARNWASSSSARRAQLAPEDFGLPGGSRRRTPGLRREELALLAGVGVTWYTWLEQGREINASVQVLDALARTLRLDRAEREHLYWLAEASPLLTGAARRPIPAEVREIVGLARPAAGQPDQRPVRHPAVERRVRGPVLGLARDAVHPQEHAVVLHHRAERAREVPAVRAGDSVPRGAASRRLRQARRRPGLGGGHPAARPA